MARKNERSVTIAPAYTPKATETQIPEEQKILVAGPGAGAAMIARPQSARLTADAAEFQPSRVHDASGAVPGTNTENYFQESLGQREGHSAGACGDERPTNLVGDNVTGMPRDGYANQATPWDAGADMATGGEPRGPGNHPGPQDSHRGVSDWPEQKGSGTEPLQKGAQLGK